ncbi:calcium-activated potassium channel slowpoke-like [Brachionus plicatilis]|uniref:BK channel n=1 Tax=Brachionus plicatilis TaxID=10195 RepID=A0A3M7T4B9_BRAPC|nr:calcium-activated potassium channel slowpoke-like [Brachionus plicatilis]
MGQTSTSLDNSNLDPECIGRRYWYVFLMSSLITFFGGLLIIFVWRFLTFLFVGKFFKKIRKRIFKTDNIDAVISLENSDTEIGWVTAARDFCGELISAQSISGRILMILVSILSVGSLVIYFFDASTSPIETCQKWKESVSQQIDLGFNLFFMLYFFIRFVAAQDKLWFWLDIYSIVDYFTIPPSFVSIYLDRNWIGLRFLRVLRLMNIPDILQYLNLLKTSNSIRLTQLFVMFLSIWLTAAGFVHLVN